MFTENNSTNSESSMSDNASNINLKSIGITNDKLKIERSNKLTQTPEVIPEPDYNNPVLSSMAYLGKTINEKITKNHDLQIGDVINCIGEFLMKNLGNNGWVLLEYPVQPLQMALLEYMLTGRIPYFGKKLCNQTNKKSCIIPEYPDNGENVYTPINTYFSHCIKIIKRKDEMKNEKWKDFLRFYNEQDECISVLISYLNDNIKLFGKAADILVGLILNEQHAFKTNKMFKLIDVLNDNSDDSSIESDKDNDDEHSSEQSLIVTDENIQTIHSDQITNKFQLLSSSLNWNDSNPTDRIYKTLHLHNMWETMEFNFTHKIKELLNRKNKLFDELKINNDLILNTINQETLIINNPCIQNLLDNYKNTFMSTNNTKHLEFETLLLQLQFDMWDQVDDEFEKITERVKHTIDDRWIAVQNKTLISIYEQLLEIELNRATTTLNFLKRYYDDTNKYEIVEFNDSSDSTRDTINDDDETDAFQMYYLSRICKFKKYVYENFEETNRIDHQVWTQCVIEEKNRFGNQVDRIKSSMLVDKIYLNYLTRIDGHLEKIHNLHKFKINDINNLCELMKCAEDAGKNINGRIKQISGKFYIDQLSVLEIFCQQIFTSKDNFNTEQLTIMVNTLLDIAPRYKMPMRDLIDTLNGLNRTHSIYPTNWPTDDQFYNHFPKELLGSNPTTVDWRDFVVQCMELPCPGLEQILYYRRLLFQVNDIGDETIAVDRYGMAKLWFENKSCQHKEVKRLLYNMYRDQNGLNYSAMLLAFCRDERPCNGLLKSFGLTFDRNPFNINVILNVRNYDEYEKNVIHIEDDAYSATETYPSELSNEEFSFDETIMTRFLLENLDLYMASGNLLGNIYIPQLVKSVFENIRTKQERATIIDFFRNDVMDGLYDTVYKFQTRQVSEVAKNICMEYNLNA